MYTYHRILFTLFVLEKTEEKLLSRMLVNGIPSITLDEETSSISLSVDAEDETSSGAGIQCCERPFLIMLWVPLMVETDEWGSDPLR